MDHASAHKRIHKNIMYAYYVAILLNSYRSVTFVVKLTRCITLKLVELSGLLTGSWVVIFPLSISFFYSLTEEMRWGLGWWLIRCLSPSNYPQSGWREEAMWDVWLSIFLFFPLFILAGTPKGATSTKWLKENLFLYFIFFGDGMKVIASYITVVLPHPWPPSFPLRHQIEWGANFSL